MQTKCVQVIGPEGLIVTTGSQQALDCFNRNKGNQRTAGMWSELGEATFDRMADGAMTLARIWQSAWSDCQATNGKVESNPRPRRGVRKENFSSK